jgi:hypothetical protein
MKYFNTLPKVVTTDNNNNSIVLTNLLARVNVIPELLKNPLLYYSYDVQEGETPEIIASKYYGSPDNFWIVMFSNQLLDPEWDWPLSYANFSAYIIDKYGSASAAQSQIARYEKIITTSDSLSNMVNREVIIIDQNEYSNTALNTVTVDFGNETVVITTEVNVVSAYDSELLVNESKRNINLLNVKFLPTIQSQFKKLMGV